MIRRILMSVVVVAALALSACAGLPTSGSVSAGHDSEEEATPPDLTFLPAGPQPGATPQEIVEGFIRAGVGPADTWARAKEFLTDDFREEWNPEAGVTIDVLGDREYHSDVEGEDESARTASVALSVTSVATVDDRGSYANTQEGASRLLYELVRTPEGEWRIAAGPDGAVLADSVFTSVFRSYVLAYFDPSWSYLVPDVRWFPTTSTTVTRIADALVNKPITGWLAPAAVTAFPEGVRLPPSVPTTSNVAQVELSDEALGLDSLTLDRMLTQLEVSLASAGVSSVQMLVGQAPLEATRVQTQSTRVSGPALVLTEDGFGTRSAAGEFTRVDALSDAIVGVQARAVQVVAARDAAAVLSVAGGVFRVSAEAGAVETDGRAGVVAPTIDPFGTVWSVPADSPGALRAVTAEGTVIAVAGAFPEATEVRSLAISRDGSRMAAVVSVGDTVQTWVQGVTRDNGGLPVALTEPFVLATLDPSASQVAWLDNVAIGTIASGEDAAVLTIQQIGGPMDTIRVPSPVTALAGGAVPTAVRVRTPEGALLVRRGTNWQQSATGVEVLATQQGIPD